MKVVALITSLFFVLVSCALNPIDVDPKQSHLIDAFQHARNKGDLNGMLKAVNAMEAKSMIKKSITEDAIVKILGKPDGYTGIYIPGGYSAGYGNEKPTTENHYKFIWFHFRSSDWQRESIEEEVLIYWNINP